MHTTHFRTRELNRLRTRAQRAARPSDAAPEGWAISTVDPMRVLAVFKTLRLRPGFVLRAYHYRSGGNGNGVVWAMPIDEPLPPPDECPTLDAFLRPPKPVAALDDAMLAIEGDGSPFSYLSASLLARELAEFGAMWHGVSWGYATILGRKPQERARTRSGEVREDAGSNWTWRGTAPREWRPQVSETDGIVESSFCVLRPVGAEVISRVTDRFRVGQYTFTTRDEELGAGRGGIIH